MDDEDYRYYAQRKSGRKWITDELLIITEDVIFEDAGGRDKVKFLR